MTQQQSAEPEEPPIRFTDNRKIKLDEPAEPAGVDGAQAPSAPAGDDLVIEAPELDENAKLLEERTADLQRLQAEYANYRKRAERDRLAAGDIATGRVLAELLPVIDDLDRAKAHDDLSGPLKAVADKLDGVFAKLGVAPFGVVGDPFDPSRHEAVLHDESTEVTVPTCTTIMRQGYTLKDRLLRPAMVGVGDPAAGPDPAEMPGESPSEGEHDETPPTPQTDASAGANHEGPTAR